MIGLLNAEIVYPATTNGFRRPYRSDRAPPIHLNPLLMPSAKPSIQPKSSAEPPGSATRNRGMIG